MYACPICAAKMEHAGGYDKSGPDYGGAYLDVDHYRCPCGRTFKHVVKDNFTSGFDAWYMKKGEEWELLPGKPKPFPRENSG